MVWSAVLAFVGGAVAAGAIAMFVLSRDQAESEAKARAAEAFPSPDALLKAVLLTRVPDRECVLTHDELLAGVKGFVGIQKRADGGAYVFARFGEELAPPVDRERTL